VLHDETVPAGLTAMQALDRVAEVKTRYGGRFVQSVDGLDGDITRRRDWFYFVNGIEADIGAAEYRLHDGDVEWWDFRSWKKRMREPVVVGAFPEPFLHGFGGETHPTLVLYTRPPFASVARRLARVVGGRVTERRSSLGAPDHRNIVHVVSGRDFRVTGGADGVTLTVGIESARRLLADPTLARYRYTGLP
jgi:hypothetical protein